MAKKTEVEVKEVQVIRRFVLSEKTCPVCAKKFKGTKKKIYCSIACQQRANYERHAEAYRRQRMGVPWAAYGTFSGFHLFMNTLGREIEPAEFNPYEVPFEELRAKKPSVANKLRLAMLVEGVDLMSWPGGLVSATHGEAEIDQTLHAFASALRMLKDEGEI